MILMGAVRVAHDLVGGVAGHHVGHEACEKRGGGLATHGRVRGRKENEHIKDEYKRV